MEAVLDIEILDIEILDRPPPGHFLLTVLRKFEPPCDEWLALMINVEPGPKHQAAIWAHRPVPDVWVRIPGKHRNQDAAWDAAQDMLETEKNPVRGQLDKLADLLRSRWLLAFQYAGHYDIASEAR